MQDIYQLATRDIGKLYFLHPDFEYMKAHFVCEPMAGTWVPPLVKLVRKRAKPADFSSWMLRAPIVSERVRNILSGLCGTTVEFLPFYTTQRGEQLFAMNVLTKDPNRPLFKLDGYSLVYARYAFGEIARAHKFSGLTLEDPEADNFGAILRGRETNVFPGLS